MPHPSMRDYKADHPTSLQSAGSGINTRQTSLTSIHYPSSPSLPSTLCPLLPTRCLWSPLLLNNRTGLIGTVVSLLRLAERSSIVAAPGLSVRPRQKLLLLETGCANKATSSRLLLDSTDLHVGSWWTTRHDFIRNVTVFLGRVFWNKLIKYNIKRFLFHSSFTFIFG